MPGIRPTAGFRPFTRGRSSIVPARPRRARARSASGSARSDVAPRAQAIAASNPTAAPSESLSGAEEVPRWVTDPDCDLGPDPAAPGACLYDHKSPGGILRWSGQVISLVGEIGGKQRKSQTESRRGLITGWSEASRRRLVKMVLASDAASWGQPDDPTVVLLVTLTYPGQDGRELIPHDGGVAHRHLARFLKRWLRYFGKLRGLWKLEFQARAGEWAHEWQRCAPHWTLWAEAPAGVSLTKLREWVSSHWWQIVGSEAESHLLAGTRVEPWHGSVVGYALKYLRKGRDKEYQHQVPDGYVKVGRWWNLVGLPVQWTEAALSEHEFFVARRLMIQSQKRVRRRRSPVKVLGRYAGLWMWTRRDGAARTREIVTALMRGVQLATAEGRG